MFERYTERARRVIFFARYEASAFGSTTIESEHLLLGLIREQGNLIQRFLAGVAADDVWKEIEARVVVRERVSTSIDLPLSNECKRILAYSAEEAERQGCRLVTLEHVLLGILREENCLAAQVLSQFSPGVDVIRDDLARQPLPEEPAPEATP